MNATGYVIGVDVGTTSTKAVLFTLTGTLIEKASVEYPLLSPSPDTQEQDPDEIFAAVVNSIATVIKNSQVNVANLTGLSFSTAMHSLIAVDSEGQPLTHSITWADRRSAGWVEKIRQDHHGHAIYHRTGTPIHPMSPFVKLVWLRHEQPELFRRAAKFISIKEYILYRWFGEYVVDYSIANATGLFNMQTMDWDAEALEVAGISADRLSQIVPTTYVLRSMKARFADQMGIPATLPVVVGSSDGVLANLGVGAIAPGIVAVTVGTSGAIRGVLHQPKTDPQERLFCYALTEKQWVIGGAVNNGGIILRWVRDNLADPEVDTARLLQEDPYNILTDIAATIAPGAGGLIFHPYLAGERSPLWDANARGSFFGLTLHHTKAHLIRAVLEGIVYNLYIVLEALQDAIGNAISIRATGGFARSKLWRQMLADVFNHEVVVPESYESSSLGAAMLGLYALNQIEALDISEMLGETYRHHPIPENVEKYQKMIPIYTRLLNAFRTEYGALAQVQAELQQQYESEQ
ncbi:MAG: gluconokinase [Elainellaceae cyanobacterium]